MRAETRTLVAPQTAAASPGAAAKVSQFRDMVVQFANLTGGTHQLEGSLDGANYTQIGADVSAPVFVPIPHAVEWIRVATTVDIVGGPSTAVFLGLDSRTD